MASTSGCSHQFKGLQLSDTCPTDDSRTKSDFATATPATEADHATLSNSCMPMTSHFSAVDDQIERSKAHWSTLVDHSGYPDEEKMDFKVKNMQEFMALQMHPTWGSFFANFTGDVLSTTDHHSVGELVIGKKIAEGGQAELYEAQVKWFNPWNIEMVQNQNVKYVLKVCKEGLKLVKSQLPLGLLQNYIEIQEQMRSPTPKERPWYISHIDCGLLLKDGIFAFLTRKNDFDLRHLIECNMELRSGANFGPFSKEDAPLLMFLVALGVECLHNQDIVHRDLKTSNVLVRESKTSGPKWHCCVTNYECSLGVVGTNFFQAPEILQACKEGKVYERPEVFSRAADVYSYGMTCYEILTGKLLVDDHPLSDTHLLIDLVINQHLRPEVPKYVDDWAHELLNRCWQFDPTTRPRVGEILNFLSANSVEVRGYDALLKDKYGENYRSYR